MTTEEITGTSTADLRERLELLERERAAAALHGLDRNRTYVAHLRREVDATRSAYAAAAVTEIASLRAALGARLHG